MSNSRKSVTVKRSVAKAAAAEILDAIGDDPEALELVLEMARLMIRRRKN